MTVADNIYLIVMTPENTLLEKDVCKVMLPASKGRFMVLHNHAPVITSLEEGDVVYVSGGQEGRIHIVCGFAEIHDNKVTVCAEV